jgi:diguanylate cyclase (GGDEF)-like protein
MADSAYAAPQARAPRPFRRSGLAGRAWPFCAPLTFVLVAVLADHARGRAAGRELFGVALMVATVALTAVIPWERLPRRADAIPPLTVIVAVSLLRSATMVPQSVWAPVMLLPLFWLGLHHSRRQLMVGLALAGGLTVLGKVLGVRPGDDSWAYTMLEFSVVPPLCLTVQRIVADQRRLSLRMMAIASNDPLTGIGNRRTLDEELRRGLALAGRQGQPVCVAMLDLDHFKKYNDTFGHPAGDELLVKAAKAWTRQLRRSDLLCRYGGEEFAVLLPVCLAEEAETVLDRLRIVTPDAQTCSVGVAEWDGFESPSALLGRADAALYAAKHGGRNRVVVAGREIVLPEDIALVS